MSKAIQLNIVGAKNSGKTRVAEALIRDLTLRGFKVGSVKHTSHDHEYDTKGTDSWKHQQAGSMATLISSPNKLVCHLSDSDDIKEQKIMEAAFSDCDFIIWEGDQATNNPIIECLWGDKTPLNKVDERLIAFISEKPLENGAKYFSFEESIQLCEYVMDRFDKNSQNWA